MSDLAAILDEPDTDRASRALEALLDQPVREIGMGEMRSPEQDLIAHARRQGLTGDRHVRLSTLARALIAHLERVMARGDLTVRTLSITGRLGFLCTALELNVDALHFYKISLTLDLLIDAGVVVPLEEYFLVLRSIGRLQRSKGTALGMELFWSNKLDHDAFEIRTLAAQNLVRVSDPGRLRHLYAPTLFEIDVDCQLVAFEWLLKVGSPSALAEASGRLHPTALARLAQGLVDVGEEEAAAAVIARAAAVESAKSLPKANWLAGLPSGGPVPAFAVLDFPAVAATSRQPGTVAYPPESERGFRLDIELIRSFMGDAGQRSRRARGPQPTPVERTARISVAAGI